MDEHRQDPLYRRNPQTASAHRRQVWLQINLPLIIAVLILLALGALVLQAGQSGSAHLGQWSQAVMVVLLFPVILLTFLGLLIVIALMVVIARLAGVVPPYARRAQLSVSRVERAARRNADAVAAPVIRLHGWRAGWRAVWRRFQ